MKIFKYIVGFVFLLVGTFGVQSVSTSFEAKAEAAEVYSLRVCTYSRRNNFASSRFKRQLRTLT